jgi:hypothetical protein
MILALTRISLAVSHEAFFTALSLGLLTAWSQTRYASTHLYLEWMS